MICLAAHGQVLAQVPSEQTWPCVAGGPSHWGVSNAVALPQPTDQAPATPAWTTTQDEFGRSFTTLAAQVPVFDSNHVYISARVQLNPGVSWRLLAVRRADGVVAWSASIPAPLVDSFSSATADPARGRVMIGSGRDVICFDAATGAQVWRRTLNRNIVNASPTIADDVPGRARAFITDYDGFGTAASLYCINMDPRSPANPFDPGDLVWRVAIGGASGATPAFLPASLGGGGLVYIATLGEPSFAPGMILAYDAQADVAPNPAFIASNTINEGFFGTVSIAPPTHPSEGPTVYAVSYEFYGGVNSANLLAVDGASGAVRWSVPCNRGGSAPVVLGNGRIAVSAGVQGFGTVPSVALYLDRRDHAIEVWNSALDAWVDSDEDGLIDAGECDWIGLWSYQPIASSDLRLLTVGEAPQSASVGAFGSRVATLDVALRPGDRSFARFTESIGGSPTAGRGWVYGLGAGGLSAFSVPRIDVNADGRCTIDDAATLERGQAALDRLDVNGDGVANDADRAALLTRLRVHEASRMTTGRP